MRISKIFKEIKEISNKNEETNKYKELYKLSLEVLEQDQKRFTRIDEKASKYLSVFTILIGAYGFFGKWILDKITSPYSTIEIIIIILYIMIFSMLYASWFIVFRILYTMDRDITAFNMKMIKFFGDNKLKDIYYKLSENNRKAFEKNIEITKKKSKLLKIGHILINITVGVVLIFTIIFGYYVYKHKLINQKRFERRLVMAQKDDTTSQQGNEGTTSSGQNIEVDPPGNITVQESFDPTKAGGILKIVDNINQKKK
ncbi:MAG: hypothetical protein M1438_02030 [Deltaproteobacteria bacterium]|nr:hypothetical protein [Deltaproteobacteria bacterium]